MKRGSVEMEVIIPSHKRAGRITTHKHVPGIICVPEAQGDDYRRLHPGETIVTHPDNIIGLCSKRNWIIQRWPNCFMIDDDTKGLVRTYLRPGTKRNYRMSRSEALDAIWATAQTCKNLGAYLFGLLPTLDARNYFPQKPFRLTGFCNACAMGVLEGSKITFDPRAVVKDEFYASCINAFHHRYMFVDERFTILQPGVGKQTGGCSDYRTTEVEAASIAFLKEEFGDVVRDKTATTRWGRVRKSPTKHNCEIHIPF